VSRWLTDELYVSLSPGHIGVAHVQRKLSLSGVKREVTAKQSIARNADIESLDWDWALQEMDTLLTRYEDVHPNVVVVLSNHFVHYVLVPWSNLVSSDEEQIAHARHCFQIAYGVASSTWELRLNSSSVGSAQLASAVDEKLLMACKEIIKRHGLQLTSVQPYLMSAFNRFKHQIQRTDAWLALVEPGSICLAQLQEGEWKRLRTARLGNDWDDFSRFISREAFMGDGELQVEEQVLYVYAPYLGPLQTINGWEIHELSPPLPSTYVEEKDHSMVMALSG